MRFHHKPGPFNVRRSMIAVLADLADGQCPASDGDRPLDGVRVLDDSSLTGVIVNGERVVSHLLADGDEIVIGRYRLRFTDRSALGTEPAATPLSAE